jgi:hypothetical protein
VASGYRPDQERSQGPFVVLAVGGMPGVDVGLAELGWAAVACIQPGQEVLGLGELLAGEPSSRRGERPGSGFGAQPGELVPDAELA